MFQSLIGTLQTIWYDKASQIARQFQSLIGTLQTQFSQARFVCNNQVSIPHRYATNDAQPRGTFKDYGGFNPS